MFLSGKFLIYECILWLTDSHSFVMLMFFSKVPFGNTKSEPDFRISNFQVTVYHSVKQQRDF